MGKKTKRSRATSSDSKRQRQDTQARSHAVKADNEEESIEEAVLGDDDDGGSGDAEPAHLDDCETEESSAKRGQDKLSINEGETQEGEGVDTDGCQEESDDEGEPDDTPQQPIFDTNSKALLAKTEELLAEKEGMPWIESFAVISSTPLPFGNTDDETGMTIDVHDDLKREVAFYDIAMEAVEVARTKCRESCVPFSRPDDFFAEMVKSDDHMARVKDRLIFENKKIEAVAQRKSNKEQKLRAKEAHSNKIAEKSRRRKENLKAVDDWAQTAASSRAGGRYSDRDDQAFLNKKSPSSQGGQKRGWVDRDGNLQTGPNKKRMAANKKWGHGGKRGRFKQNDPKSMNDMSSFNPKGNFGGLGTKKGPAGSGGNRKGKRARDASKSRQRF